jgi:hypothetical protein
MSRWLNEMIDRLSSYFATRKGLLPIIGISLIAANLILQFFPSTWFIERNILLHIGAMIAILGLMLAWVL